MEFENGAYYLLTFIRGSWCCTHVLDQDDQYLIGPWIDIPSNGKIMDHGGRNLESGQTTSKDQISSFVEITREQFEAVIALCDGHSKC